MVVGLVHVHDVNAVPLERRQTKCAAVELVCARGTTEAQTNPVGSRKWKAGVQKAIPGVEVYEAVYPAAFATVATTGPKTASTDMLKHIRSKQSLCPKTKFMLFGYSQGAMSIVTLLNEPELPESAIIGTVLYGNPYWKYTAGSSMDGGTAKRGRGTFAGQKTIPAAYQSRTKDYCNENDLFCTGGTSLAVHLGYPASAQSKMSIDFAIAQIQSSISKT